jgi:hypothetical protein
LLAGIAEKKACFTAADGMECVALVLVNVVHDKSAKVAVGKLERQNHRQGGKGKKEERHGCRNSLATLAPHGPRMGSQYGHRGGAESKDEGIQVGGPVSPHVPQSACCCRAAMPQLTVVAMETTPGGIGVAGARGSGGSPAKIQNNAMGRADYGALPRGTLGARGGQHGMAPESAERERLEGGSVGGGSGRELAFCGSAYTWESECPGPHEREECGLAWTAATTRLEASSTATAATAAAAVTAPDFERTWAQWCRSSSYRDGDDG